MTHRLTQTYTWVMLLLGTFLGGSIAFSSRAFFIGAVCGAVIGTLIGFALDYVAHRNPGGKLAELKHLGRSP